jgi:DNA-binding XRE family transcriptional regulator
MKKDWLWDLKISVSEAKKILKDPDNKRFISISSLLLARKADPKEVFGEYLDPVLFCRNWQKIRKRMSNDKWGDPRIVFWQAVYQRLLEKYRKKGVQIVRVKEEVSKDPVCEAIGMEIRRVRREDGLSQEQLAQKADISQQLVSRIEKGKENISLITLKKISGALGRKVEFRFI